MRRLQLALALLVVPFGAGVAVAVLTRSENPTRTVELTTTKVEVINGSRRAGRVPVPIPTLVEGSTDPHGLALSNAVPIDANLDSADYVERRPRQLIVSWDRVHFTRNGQSAIWQRRGIAIWQLDRGNAASWHRVYTYETPVKDLALDQGTMSFAGGALVVREGVDFRGRGVHCCYRRVRLTWLRWTGSRLVTIRQMVRKNRRGWPPG